MRWKPGQIVETAPKHSQSYLCPPNFCGYCDAVREGPDPTCEHRGMYHWSPYTHWFCTACGAPVAKKCKCGQKVPIIDPSYKHCTACGRAI